MQPENRKHNRFLITQQPKGKLQVVVGDQCYGVSAVRDISMTGIRVEMGTLLDVGEKILVRYVEGKVDLKVNGIVVWNSDSTEGVEQPEDPDAYLIGIELTSPTLLQVFL